MVGPDGSPINADGKHPQGKYSDLVGQPIRDVIAALGGIQAALNAAYRGYHFDPRGGESTFRQTLGLAGTDMTPGDQFKMPYSVQFNLGVQRELHRGLVLAADYIDNHGVGLPRIAVDYERRRDAATLNAPAASKQVAAVLAGKTVDQWMAANPTRTISAFNLVNDVTFPGLYPISSVPCSWPEVFPAIGPCR